MSTVQKVDVAIIGAGSAGLNARRAVEQQGGSVLMIDDGPYGTTCARVGCMPSKLLIAAAEAAHHIDHAHRFGVQGEFKVDGAAVMDRVKRERDRFVGFVVRGTEAIPTEKRLRLRARFDGLNRLSLSDGSRVEVGAVVIASGSSSWLPPPFRGLGERVMFNDQLFDMETLPKKIAVIGCGVIGIELGQALNRLGVEVRFFAIDDIIGAGSDPAVKASVRVHFESSLEMKMECQSLSAEAEGEGVRLRWRDKDGVEGDDYFERILASTGRRANVADLNLESTGIQLQRTGIPEYDPETMRCGESNIFLAGDVTADLPLLHEASDEGKIAGRNAARLVLGKSIQRYARRTPLGVVFTDPNIATVGRSYASLQGEEFGVGEIDFSRQGRARVMGRNQGLVRIYGAQDGTLLGAELFGPDAEHHAHLLSWAIQQGLSVQEALRMPFYHPVTEEGLRTALRDLATKLKLDREELRLISD